MGKSTEAAPIYKLGLSVDLSLLMIVRAGCCENSKALSTLHSLDPAIPESKFR